MRGSAPRSRIMPGKLRLVGVIGAADAGPEILTAAEEVGSLLARAGCVLVCGGLGGVMTAVARGAKREGGLTVGILPGPGRDEANAYVDVPIATNMGNARNAVIAQACDCLIAIGGQYGTLSEIALGLALGKRVIGLRTWEIDPAIVRAGDAQSAVKLALSDEGPVEGSSR